MLTSDGSFTEANTFEAYGCFARRRMEIWFLFFEQFDFAILAWDWLQRDLV